MRQWLVPFHLALVALACILIPDPAACGRTRMELAGTISVADLANPFGLIGGLCMDEARGRLYVADSRGGRILAFDNQLKFISEFTAGGELGNPAYLARSAEGVFYVSDPVQRRVLAIDMAARSTAALDIGTAGGDNPVHPGPLAVGPDGSVYVLDRGNARVLVFGQDRSLLRQFGVSAERGLADIKIDHAGRVFVLSTLTGQVDVYDPDGTLRSTLGHRGSSDGETVFPVSLAVDERGVVYVLDRRKARVQAYDMDGRSLFTLDGGEAQGKGFQRPSFMLAAGGGIYVVDQGASRIFLYR